MFKPILSIGNFEDIEAIGKVNPKVSIVIVNWNTRELLLRCLASIRANAAQCEVVVVDNGSSDGSVEAVQKEFPEINLLALCGNEGYARANMMGLGTTSGEYILFLNSDTLIPAKAIDGMADFLDSRAQVAACGPQLRQQDGATQPFAFGGDPKLGYLMARACARIGMRAPLHDWDTAAVQTVDWVSGACLLVRRSALEQVGGFDERMFMYFEDSDLCLRLRNAGWQIVYYPRVSITHMGGASLSSNAHRGEYYYRSLEYFYSKHYSFPARLSLRILLPLYKRCFSWETPRLRRP